MFLIFFFISIISSLPCEEFKRKHVYSPTDVFECINSLDFGEEYNQDLITAVTNLFETYVYKDICKNPPQPSDNPNYYTSIDIDETLAAINPSKPFYEVYQNLKDIIFQTHDLHLSLYMTSSENQTFYIDSFYYILPFNLKIENDHSVFASQQQTSYEIYIPEIIEKNKEIEIESIDGMKPLEWIRKFGNEKMGLKSPHGRFTYAVESFDYGLMSYNPFDFEFFNKNITVKYVNGEEFSVHYEFIYLPAISLNEHSKLQLKLRNEGKVFSPLKVKDFDEEFIRNYEKEWRETIEEESNFDLVSPDGNVGCKIYEDKKINLIVLKTFMPTGKVVKFFKTFNECIARFDNNTYPITMILPLNGGGMLDLEGNVENFLAPQAETTSIGSVRISKGSEHTIKLAYGQLMKDPENCEMRYNTSSYFQDPIGTWYSEPIVNYYGDVEHVRSKVSLIPPRTFLKGRLEKNPRKPTEIVVFTDAFCYSACSLLTKGLREQGNAILAGYHGDPELEKKQFDCGQSPTAVIGSGYTLTPDALALQQLGGHMQISFFETYKLNYNYNEETIPREFIQHPVDERVEIFRYEEQLHSQFADEALKILKKYETECDPENKRLVKYADECDSKMTIEHAHGGYICGDDGKWTTECVAAYCDEGYKFDYYNQKCVYNVCFPPEEESEEKSEETKPESVEEESQSEEWSTGLIIGCSVVAVVVVLVILGVGIGIIVHCSKRKNNSKYQTLE